MFLLAHQSLVGEGLDVAGDFRSWTFASSRAHSDLVGAEPEWRAYIMYMVLGRHVEHNVVDEAVEFDPLNNLVRSGGRSWPSLTSTTTAGHSLAAAVRRPRYSAMVGR